MEKSRGFNLHQTMRQSVQACQGRHLSCFLRRRHSRLDHRCVVAAIVLSSQRKQRRASPISVGRRLAILCVILTVPGILALLVGR